MSSDRGRVVVATKAPRLHEALDENVCMEILVRLPIKPVIKFQTVCKQWLSLISSDHFRRLHTLRHHQPPPCIILRTREPRLCHFNLITKQTMMIPFSINIPSRCSEIFSSSNGLVILYGCNDNYFHVCNPITKQSRKICFSLTDSLYSVRMLNLVFDPNSKSLHYKVVCIRAPIGPFLSDRNDYKMEVFDSDKGTWKGAGIDPITLSSTLLFFNNTCYNNNIYGMNYSRDGHRSIYCIDIDKKVVRILTSPRDRVPEEIYCGKSIQEWNGCLYYSALLYSLHSGNSAFLWELEDDKWSLKHVDRLPFSLQWSYVRLLRFVPQTSTLILVCARKIIAYSFLEKSCNELLSLQELDEEERIHVFDQTLAPV